MNLAAGARLGPYEVVAPLGAGGMGEVYRARDTRLDRGVALKVLPAELSDDPVALARFEREAKAVAATSHPNILAVFDFGTADRVAYIVTELLDGETLRQRLSEGPLPARKAIEYGIQIAFGLAAAHDKGIVHRDLKPENLFLTKDDRVKILDFGLARQGPLPTDDSTSSPTLPRHTVPGTVLGTVGYMSPEQVRGLPAGPPCDIFSFGAVLYEMLSGNRAFRGDSAAETMHAILKEDPHDLVATSRRWLPALERVLLHCLEKRPEQRFQTARDLAFALDALSGVSIARAPPTLSLSALRWRMPVWLGIATALVAAATAVWTATRSRLERSVTLRRLTSDSGLTTDAAISPDGKLVAYASDRAGQGNLDIWVQHMSGGDEPLRLTKDRADDTRPCFSPDGSRIVFHSERDGGGVYLIPSLGGKERLIARHGNSPRFSPDGSRIAFFGQAGRAQYLTVVASSGAESREFTGVSSTGGVMVPLWAPDGRHVLIGGCQELPPNACDWFVIDVEASEPTGFVGTGAFEMLARHSIVERDAWSWSGDRILFSARHGDNLNLFEARISLRSFRIVDELPRQLITGTEEVDQPSVDPSGRMIFAARTSSTDLWELSLDANRGAARGEPRVLTKDIAADDLPSLSDDGRKLAFLSARLANRDVWLRDLESGHETALTTTAENELQPVIAHDGSRVAYGIREGGETSAFVVSSDGGAPERLCRNCGAPTDWSHDGRSLLFQLHAGGVTPRYSLGVLDVSSGKATEILAHKDWLLFRGHLSPDDEWIAFHAYSSKGTRNVVAPFRGHRAVDESEWIVVTGEQSYSDAPRWSPDGSLIYYLGDGDGFRCVWAQRLEPETKKPAGEPFVVHHFHGHQRSLSAVHPNWADLTLGRDRMIFNMAERRSNIWVAEFK